jgi:hypothetical protein
MMFIVLGDDAIFNRARTGAKSYAVEETDLEENAKIVAHLSKRYGDNIRKSHVMSAAKDFGVDASKLSKAVRKHLDKTMLPEAKEKTEYDYEGDMAMGQLKSIIANSQRMHDMLSDDTNLPEWVQSKITLAEDYISTASNYMQGEMNEEQIDEISKKTLGSYVKKASGAEQPKNVMSPKNVPLTKIAAYQGDSETGHFGKRFNQHTYDKAERLRKNRETGIKRAVDKLTKEDVELDEGNTTPEIKKAYADLIKTPSGSSERKTAIRHYKSLRQNLAKEEVEQVDEVSKRTLGRYINKAKDSIDMTSYRSGIKDGTAISSSTPYKSNNPLEKKLSKRHKGIETAVKKLTKEDIDVARSMHESYKMKFDAALEYYNIKSPSELGEDKRKEFFNHVDQEFKKGDN